MRALPEGLGAHLASGTTTLCWCWRIIRSDGVVLGFTDHDRDLEIAGTIYEAASGLAATEARESVGLSVDNLEVAGALTSDRLSESDLAAGKYDDARVDVFRVNWRDVAQHLLVRSGSIGEVRRGELAFAAELRGLTHYLQQEKGRIYQFGCDADLGDQRCGVDLEQPAFVSTAVVAAVLSARRFRVTGSAGYATDWFSAGSLTWTGGANITGVAEIKQHTLRATGLAEIELWDLPAHEISVGDELRVRAGCDKQFGTCRLKFANHLNFRGFAHMPGNDFLTRYANRDDVGNDGGSMNR